MYKTVEHLPGTNKVNRVSYVYGSNRESAHQLTTHSNYVYDANGSVLSSAKINKSLLMDYDIRSNLVSSIAVNNQYIIDYDYDASGERVYSGMGNSSKIYINSITSNPLTIIDSNDNVTHYIYGPKGIVAKRNESLTYHLLKDHLGSTRVVMNENNQAISSYDYDAWGNPMNSTVSEESAYRYTGREYDDETGLHNFRARLYDSTLMRFYQVDPAEQFASPYVYCGSNPIGLVDHDGKEVKLIGSRKSIDEMLILMNSSTSSLHYSSNKSGILSATIKGTDPLSKVDDHMLSITMYSPYIRVNVHNIKSGILPGGDVIAGGAYGGNRRDWWPFDEVKRIADTYIHVPSAKAYHDVGGCDVGELITHEIRESYIGATTPSLFGPYTEANRDAAHAETIKDERPQQYPQMASHFKILGESKFSEFIMRRYQLFWELDGKKSSWEIEKRDENSSFGVPDESGWVKSKW